MLKFPPKLLSYALSSFQFATNLDIKTCHFWSIWNIAVCRGERSTIQWQRELDAVAHFNQMRIQPP